MKEEIEMPLVEDSAAQKDKILLSLDEAAEFLGIPKSTLHSWSWAGRVPCVRLGRRRFFRKEDLLLWIERHVCPAKGSSSLTRASSRSTMSAKKWTPGRKEE